MQLPPTASQASLSKPCVCRHRCPWGLGSCCGDSPGLISRELSNDTEGAKAESETHLKGKDSSLQNVKDSCYMTEQGRELKKDKKRNTGKIEKQVMNFCCCCFLAGSKLWELDEIGHQFLNSKNLKNLELVRSQI